MPSVFGIYRLRLSYKSIFFGVNLVFLFAQIHIISTKPININDFLAWILQLMLQMGKTCGGKIQVQNGFELLFYGGAYFIHGHLTAQLLLHGCHADTLKATGLDPGKRG